MLTPLILLIFISSHSSGQALVNGDCHQFRTQTQGGWGSSASGNNPGSYRDAHFGAAFPNGIVLGCDYTLTLSSAHAVQTFLPSGGPASALTANWIDPTNYNNVLAGQLLALTLSVGFDNNDPNFAPSQTALADQIVSGGTFAGFSVAEVLAEANLAFGGCTSAFSLQQLNTVLTSINENYVDGTSNGGFLDCPEEETECQLEVAALSAHCIDGGFYEVALTIAGNQGGFDIHAPNAISISGAPFCVSSGQPASIVLTFAQGTDYSFSVIPSSNAGCATGLCGLPAMEGMAPDCCNLEVSCPDTPAGPFACISDIPAANSSAITVGGQCGETNITVSETATGTGCQGNPYQLIRTYTITDGSNVVTCVQAFNVVPISAPVIVCPPDQYATCTTTIFPIEQATATSHCGGAVQITYSNGPVTNCSQFTRTWVAIDACGYTAQCTQTVFVEDNTPPVLQVPQNATIGCGLSVSPILTGIASANDHCSAVTLTYTDGAVQGGGCSTHFVRTWIATDACGNAATGDQTITQTDMTGPAIFGVPANQQIQCGEIPGPAEAMAVDACSGDTVAVTITETLYENGCLTMVYRVYSATDLCGNTTNLYRNIRIEDTQGPQITCPSDVLLQCGDENTDPGVLGMAEAFDNCSGSNVILSYQDGVRNNNACPPVMERVWTAVDTCGNVSNCIQRIMWDDQISPVITCAGDLTVNCSESGIHPDEIGYATAIDECSTVSLIYSDGPMEGTCPLTFVRTWTATDACGNSAQCGQTITVIDDAPPTIVCPADVQISCGYVTASPAITGFPQVSDQCTAVSYTYVDGPPTGTCPEVFERTWIATDFCGNTAQCVQTIALYDNMLPWITCPGDAVVNCGEDTSPETLGMATAVDFCNDLSIAYVDAPIPGSCPEAISRIWTATDACGNARSCTQTITYAGETLPEITCAADLELDCEADTSPEFTGVATASLACGGSVEVTYTDSVVTIGTGGGTGEPTTGNNDCGQLRTQTQGGWGSSASGNNPGTYRDAHFDAAFPSGLILGCDYTLTLTSSAAVQAFLPNGGPVVVLTSNLIDPTGFSTVLAGQLVAATLSVGFDAHDPNFGASQVLLGDMVIGSGAFQGQTVSEVLAIANQFFGGCTTTVSGTALVNVLTHINESYVDGTGNGGFLECPDGGDGGDDDDDQESCATIYRTWTATDACGHTATCVQVITLSNNTDEPTPFHMDALLAYPSPTEGELNLRYKSETQLKGLVQVVSLQGTVLISTVVNGESGQVPIDLSGLERGFYLITVLEGEKTYTTKIFKN